MRALVAGVLLIAVGAIVGIVGWEFLRHDSGHEVSVLLRDRAGLSCGDPVVLGDREIGRVDEVEAEGNRVRVRLRLGNDATSELTQETTFKVETDDDDNHSLSAHVLDPAAPPLRDGDTLEGVGSTLELTLRKAAVKAARLLDRAGESEWVKQAARRIDSVITEIDRTDWDAVGRDVERHWRSVETQLREVAAHSEAEARSAYDRLEPEVERVLDQLEAAGKSKEANELRKSFDALWQDDPPTPPPDPPPPPKLEKEDEAVIRPPGQ